MSPPVDYALLKDKSVIITGGASGLGRATATKFAAHGAYVTIADVQDELGQETAKEISSQGGKVTFVHCDTTDWESSLAAFKHAMDFSPSELDVAVLFAGVDGERKSMIDLIEKTDGEMILHPEPPRPPHRAIDVNLIGVYFSTYLALHFFRFPGKSPRIPGQSYPKKSLVLISSVMGYIDCTYNVGYGISKYGVRGLFRSIRSSTHLFGVRTNSIAPGYVLTEMATKVHGITSPEQKSIKTGTVLPWCPIDYVVDSVGYCATEEDVDGRAFMVRPSGFTDMEEDFDEGYGGDICTKMLEEDGLTKIETLFPKK